MNLTIDHNEEQNKVTVVIEGLTKGDNLSKILYVAANLIMIESDKEAEKGSKQNERWRPMRLNLTEILLVVVINILIVMAFSLASLEKKQNEVLRIIRTVQ